MRNKNSKNVLDRAFIRQFLGMILLSPFNVITTIVDILFISRSFGELSPPYLSAVGLITPINMFFFLISDIISNGTNTCVSRSIGKGDRKHANDIIRTGVGAGLTSALFISIFALILTHPIISILGATDRNSYLHMGAVDYLRGFAIGAPGLMLLKILLPLLPLDSDMKHTSIASGVMAVTDIIFDAVNIYVIKGGMFGMALASSLSIYLALIFVIPHFFKKRYALKLCKGNINYQNLKEMITTGAPKGLTSALYTVQSFALNRMLIYTGGELALLANSVVGTLSNIFCTTNAALGSTVHTMIGIATGEENIESVHRTRNNSLKYGTIANALSGMILITLAPLLTRIFVKDPGTIASVTVCVRLFGIALMIMSLNCYHQSFFEASGQKKRASIFALFYTGILPVMNFILLGIITRSMLGVFTANIVTQVGMWLITFIGIRIGNIGKPRTDNEMLMLPDNFGPEEDDVMNFYITNSKQVHIASELAEDYVRDRGGDKRTAMMISLAVEEMAQNIVDHGTPKSGQLMINIRIVKTQNNEFSISIRDNCNYFDPVARLEDMSEDSGLGIKMISGVAKSFEYMNTVDTNHLMIKI